MRKKRVELVQKKLYKDVRTQRHDGRRRAQVAVERPPQHVIVRTHLLKYEGNGQRVETGDDQEERWCGVVFLGACVGVGGGDEKTEESGGTKKTMETILPTETLGVEINYDIITHPRISARLLVSSWTYE